MTVGLTPRQHLALGVIQRSYAERGIAPTYEELCTALSMQSKSHARRLVIGLEERGAIRLIPNRARGIELVDPDAAELAKILGPGLLEAANAYAVKQKIKPEVVIREAVAAYLGVG